MLLAQARLKKTVLFKLSVTVKIKDLVRAIWPSTAAVVADLSAVGQGKESSLFGAHVAVTCAWPEATGMSRMPCKRSGSLDVHIKLRPVSSSDLPESTAVQQRARGMIMWTVAVTVVTCTI